LPVKKEFEVTEGEVYFVEGGKFRRTVLSRRNALLQGSFFLFQYPVEISWSSVTNFMKTGPIQAEDPGKSSWFRGYEKA